MQLFFKNKIYIYWLFVQRTLSGIIVTVQSHYELALRSARLSYYTYDNFCLADFHLATRLLHLPHLRAFRLPRDLSFPSDKREPVSTSSQSNNLYGYIFRFLKKFNEKTNGWIN